MCCNWVAAETGSLKAIPKWQPDQRSSSGGGPNPSSFSAQFAGTFGIHCPFRDVEELFEGTRPLDVDHTTVWRWVQRYGSELEQRMRRHLKPTNKSWRVDETYVRVKGRWCYLYRAIDSAGATIDFPLSALRDADAAKRLFRKALSNLSHPQPRVINTDLAPIYATPIPAIKKEGTLRRRAGTGPYST